jgi:ribonuclease T1
MKLRLFLGVFLLLLDFSCGQNNTADVSAKIPKEAYTTFEYVQKYNKAPEGYVGGRHFGNFERRLPEKTTTGQRIKYREWDIHPAIKGKNRGAERIVTGSDKRGWYTPDHYNSFILMN